MSECIYQIDPTTKPLIDFWQGSARASCEIRSPVKKEAQ